MAKLPPQKKRWCPLPDAAILVHFLGDPWVTKKLAVGTATFDENALPPHFWHSVQWQIAVRAGSPIAIDY